MNRTQDVRLHDIGPESVGMCGVSGSFQGLWRLSGAVPPPHQDNLVVVTEEGNLRRVKDVLNALPAECAARQAVVVMGTTPRGEASVCLVEVLGQYVERLELYPGAVFLPELLEPLIHPAMTNHVWWAREHAPSTETLRATARLADQIILDTLTDAPTLVACTLSDLSWERSAPWRALVARTLDAPDHQANLPGLERAVVRYAAGDTRPARLFAAWLMDRLDWEDASHVQLVAVHSERGAGDLDGLEISGPGFFGFWDGRATDVRVRLTVGGSSQDRLLPLLPGSLVDGLAALLSGSGDSGSQLLMLARSVAT
jgi:glucose-6-phosphate dehydrogenase assembly protein OpcA